MKYFLLALAAGAVGYYVGSRRAALPAAADADDGDAPSGSLFDRIGASFTSALGGGAGGAASSAGGCGPQCGGGA